MKSCDSLQGDVWSYRGGGNRALIGALVFGAAVSGVAALVAGDSFIERLPYILLFVLMNGFTVWSVKSITMVQISRKDAVIRKVERSLIFRRCRTYSLKDFHEIALTENVRTGEEGYLMVDYSLILQGPKGKLVIFTTSDRKEAERLQEELRGYLNGRSSMEGTHLLW